MILGMEPRGVTPATDCNMQSATAELARSALDAAPDAMIILDGAGVIRFANRQASVLFGYEHQQLIGERVERLLPERFRNRHVGHREAYVRAPRVRPMGQEKMLFGRRHDGGEFPVEISLSPIQDGDTTLVAAAIRDATERRRVEAELRSSRESAELARQYADHLREVADEARENAERANRSKGRFLATASHDLRQPLQTLALLNGTLRRTVRDADATEALEEQEHAISAMSRLLNALLDISKLESGAVKPEVTDFRVRTLLEGLRREFASVAASKGLELEVRAPDDVVHSDPALIEQIMKNLVSNAIKYTRKGRIVLRAERNGASIRIDVEDTGIGIPRPQLDHIYEEFYQVGVPTNSTRDGYGLGLSIVQRLVKLLDLRLEVTSEVDHGSDFSLLVPAGAAPEVKGLESATAPTAVPQTGAARVLLVEDDPGVRNATRMLLKVAGYRVHAVASLSEALQAVEEQGAPELLVTDYHLAAGELGTEVISRLRAHVGAELKAVLVTGDTSAAIREFPADAHLRIASKPINAEQLLTVLGELLAG